MKIQKSALPVALATALLCAGCAPSATRIDRPLEVPEVAPETPPDRHYQAIVLRGPEYIDALRAEPAPADPEVVEGKNDFGDQRELAAQGYVRIGNGRYAISDAESMRAAIDLGREVGADRVVLYPQFHGEDEADSETALLAAYYVRFKLLFGATFRNLTASERERLGVDSGVQIGSVVGGTPASQANLMAGDYVLGFNGRSIRDRGEFQQMLLDAAGQAVSLSVRRSGQNMQRTVRLGARIEADGQPR